MQDRRAVRTRRLLQLDVLDAPNHALVWRTPGDCSPIVKAPLTFTGFKEEWVKRCIMVHASETTGYGHRVGLVRIGCALAVSMGLAACSADVTRLEAPFYGFGGEDAPRATAPSSAPVPSVGIYDNRNSEPRQAAPDRVAYARPESSGVERAPLSMPPQPGYEDVSPGVARRVPKPISSFEQPEPVSRSAPGADGQSITVQQGDTLYGLARRHATTVAALKDANGLAGSNLKPGQTLVLPNGSSVDAAVARPAPVARAPAVVSAPPRNSVVLAASHGNDWGGSHTIRSGDSLYQIARSKGVTVAELKRVNGIDDPRRLKPGMVLKVPGDGGMSASPSVARAPEQDRPKAAEARHASGATVASRAGTASIGPQPSQGPDFSEGGPKILNSEPQSEPGTGLGKTVVASAEHTKTDAAPPVQMKSGKLKWPVVGRVVSGFGKRKDGSHNDGVDIAVPPGTDVRAAEDGVVAYSGSEVKGFGNLLLVRHESGMVTAYAHNDKLLVQRGDRVRRGQVVAKSGNSGGADRPQLHFEVRNGSKPVDPLQHLEKL